VKVRPRFSRNGHAYDPNAQQKEASIQKAQLLGEEQLFTGPVAVEFHFVFPRPKAHYRSGKNSAQLRPDAPKYCMNKKDMDNMEKFYSDAFNCIAWADDCQIIKSSAVKRWAEPGEVPHVLIMAEEVRE